MRNIAIVLLTLLLIGILWLSTGIGKFSEEKYVSAKFLEASIISGEDLDIEFLKKEFVPAYEF